MASRPTIPGAVVDLEAFRAARLSGAVGPLELAIPSARLLAVQHLVRSWEAELDRAYQAVIDAPLGSLDEAVSVQRVGAVRAHLEAARLRLARVICEESGRRWLRVVGGGRRG